MKLRIIASASLIILLSIGISTNAGAHPWRGHRGGWYLPRPVVRVWAPAPVIVPPVVVGGYCGPRYSGPACYPHRYYGHRRYYGPHHCR